MSDPPILCTWTGTGFDPASRVWAKRADESYVVGAQYMVEAREARSIASHNFYFAAVHEAFLNLPEALAERFPSADHLRKYALIRAGFRDERTIVCASKAEAQRVAAFVKPMDSYAVVVVHEAMVIVSTAKSQSMKAMGRKTFNESKDSVLEILAAMVKTTPGELKRAAGEAA